MAPTLKETIRSLFPRETPSLPSFDSSLGSAAGPLSEASNLLGSISKRDDDNDPDPSYGVLDPHDISNVGFFVLFALIGVAFVVTGIWFFFWAKNGGFHFKETDWDDYKTTVLRRKGPNGTLLSGATESTNLGGGSVYKDYDVEDSVYNAGYARFGRKDGRRDDDDKTVLTESTGMTGITAGPSDIGAREKRKAKKEMRERERERERRRKEKSSTEKEAKASKHHVGQNGVEDEEAERAAKKELRSYRHEKSARVGGLNKESEGSQWDGSTNPTDSTVSSSLLSNRQNTPTSTPTKDQKGIRKVYSTTDKVEAERLKQEARRKRREEREAAGSPGARTSRRDFSYQRSVVGSESALTESLLEGGQSGISEETGTKSYHHPRPELRAQRQKEREERRERKKGGYRRGRGEDDEEL